jgi:hypothetical protein
MRPIAGMAAACDPGRDGAANTAVGQILPAANQSGRDNVSLTLVCDFTGHEYRSTATQG